MCAAHTPETLFRDNGQLRQPICQEPKPLQVPIKHSPSGQRVRWSLEDKSLLSSNRQLVVNKALSFPVTLPLDSLTPSGGNGYTCFSPLFLHHTKGSSDLKKVQRLHTTSQRGYRFCGTGHQLGAHRFPLLPRVTRHSMDTLDAICPRLFRRCSQHSGCNPAFPKAPSCSIICLSSSHDPGEH